MKNKRASAVIWIAFLIVFLIVFFLLLYSMDISKLFSFFRGG